MKRALGIVLMTLALFVTPATAFAESLQGRSNWQVTYNTRGRMVDNYSTREYVDQISELQPGDDITFEVKLNHENATAADWYMSNEVITTLEDMTVNNPEGSAYEYLLTYEGPNRSRTLYDSTRVGGDDGDGLFDATDALEDFFYLDTFATGQRGVVKLRVALDGETEGNAYFDTLARLKMAFAVEPTDNPNHNNENRVVNRTKLVRTGDSTRLFPLYVVMFVSGFLFLALAMVGVKERKREREEGLR